MNSGSLILVRKRNSLCEIIKKLLMYIQIIQINIFKMFLFSAYIGLVEFLRG